MKSFIDKHIRADVTALVSDPYNFYSSTLFRKSKELSAPFLDYEAAARAAGWTYSKADGYWRHPTYTQPYSYAHILCGCEGISPHEIPIIGHYIVTAELADKLSARGERVERDFGGNIVWARKSPYLSGENHGYFVSLDRDPVLASIFEEGGW